MLHVIVMLSVRKVGKQYIYTTGKLACAESAH